MSSKIILRLGKTASLCSVLEKKPRSCLPESFKHFYQNLEKGERTKIAKLLNISTSSLSHFAKGDYLFTVEQAIILSLISGSFLKIEELRPDLKKLIKTVGVSICNKDQITINLQIHLKATDL